MQDEKKQKRHIRVGDLRIEAAERAQINDILKTGRISEGPKTRKFEQGWADFIGTKYCVAVSSGAAALMVAFTALKYMHKLEARPKVITSPLTYISDASALTLCGFEPVFVDIDPKTFCITPETIQAHLESVDDPEKYSVILPIDLMGYSVELDRIKAIAKKYNLIVVEDAAEAHGTEFKGKKAGSDAALGIYSFYIAHNVQVGEMGAVTTNDPEIYRMVRKLKAQGRACECASCTRVKGVCPILDNYDGNDDFDPRFSHDLIGFNFKIMEFQAGLGLAQLDRMHSIIEKRKYNVYYLNKRLKKFADLFELPKEIEDMSYFAYTMVIKKPDIIFRKFLRDELGNRGIETRPLFGSIPTQQKAYAHLKEQYQGKLPHADWVGLHGLYLGAHQYVEQEDLDYIADQIEEIVDRKIKEK